MTKYEKTVEKIKEFNDERDWNQFHTPKNVAVSITLEASELLEHFQWDDDKSAMEKCNNDDTLSEIKDEIGDIANYLIVMCNQLDIDLLDAIDDKLEKNKKKYPVEKCKGKANKYTEYI